MVLLRDGRTYSAEWLTLGKERLTFRDSDGSSVLDLDLADVSRVRVEQSGKDWRTVGYFAGISAVTATSAALTAEGLDNKPELVLGVTAFGALLGLIVAPERRVWRDVWVGTEGGSTSLRAHGPRGRGPRLSLGLRLRG